MDKFKRITSANGKRSIAIVKAEEGSFSLQQFILKYDEEEDCYYEIRQLPDPSGKYGDLDLALKEAERLLNI